MNAEELIKDLQKRIQLNEFENMKLPTEDVLMEEYGVTRYRIRKTIEELVNIGLIYQVQGSGMYVKEPQKDTLILSSTQGIVTNFPDKKVSSKVLDLKLEEADEVLATKFKCEVGTPIYFLTRLRYLNGKPFSIEYSQYNQEMVSYLDEEIAEGSLYSYIEDELNLSIGFADKVISADKINQQQADLLNLEENDPGLLITDTVYLANGNIFNISTVLYNYKLAKLFDVANLK